MNSQSDRLLPLARVKRGLTLSSSPAGDQHFLVKGNGSAEKIPLEKACKLYIAAKKKGDLLWNKAPTKRGSKSAESAEENQSWRDELREKLGYKPETP